VDRDGALAVRGPEAVRACVAAAEDDDLLAGREDLPLDPVADDDHVLHHVHYDTDTPPSVRVPWITSSEPRMGSHLGVHFPGELRSAGAPDDPSSPSGTFLD
jgi:hypothetical protein